MKQALASVMNGWSLYSQEQPWFTQWLKVLQSDYKPPNRQSLWWFFVTFLFGIYHQMLGIARDWPRSSMHYTIVLLPRLMLDKAYVQSCFF